MAVILANLERVPVTKPLPDGRVQFYRYLTFSGTVHPIATHKEALGDYLPKTEKEFCGDVLDFLRDQGLELVVDEDQPVFENVTKAELTLMSGQFYLKEKEK